jgi:hypothetical protein
MGKTDKFIDNFRVHLSSGEEIISVVIYESETVPLLVLGTYETKRLGQDSLRSGSLIATNQRLVFFAKKMTGYEIETFPYKAISSIEQSKGLMGGQVKIIASGNTSVVKWINDVYLLGKLIETVREQISLSGTSSQGNSYDSSKVIEQIKQLSELHRSGILSDEEFSSKKQSLLDKI